MAANKVIDEIVISSDDEDDDIICDTTKPARCALCSWPVKDEAEDKCSHILSHFNPRYNTQIKHPSELTHPSEHYCNFIRLHHQCFPKKFPKSQYVTPKPEPEEDDEDEEPNLELQDRTPEPEESKESFECDRFFEKEWHLIKTHDKEKQKSLPPKSEVHKSKATWEPDLEERKETPKPEEPKKSFECPECDKSYSRKGSLYVHRYRMHRAMNLAKSKKTNEKWEPDQVQHGTSEPIVCKDCGQRFETTGGLNRHRSRKHGIYTRYYCTKCHKQLGKQTESHVALVHVHGDFRCSGCYYRSKNKFNVTQHIRNKKHSVMHGQAQIETLDQTYEERLKEFKDQFIINLADQEVPKIGKKAKKKQMKPTEKEKQQRQRPETARHRQSVDRYRKTALYCKECDYVFKPSLHLSVPSHLASVHLKQNTLFCSKCEYSTYYDMSEIRNHAKVHGGKAQIRDERCLIEEKLKQLRDENIITVRIDAQCKMIKGESIEKSEERDTEVNEDVNQEGNGMKTESGEEQQGAENHFCAHCDRLFVSKERFKKHQELVKNMERLSRTLIKFPMKGKKKGDP